MDWSRAKTILILSFLALNIMLGYELWASNWNLAQLNPYVGRITEELSREMRSKNIVLDTTIPREVPRLKGIVVQLDEQISRPDKTRLSAPMPYSRITPRIGGKDALFNQIARAESYQLDLLLGEDEMIVFNQMHGKFPIFEVSLELYLEEGQIHYYRQAFVEIEEGTDQQEQRVIPAQTAVRSLVENNLPSDSIITDVRLGYHGRFFNSDKQLLLPTWRVMVRDGDVYYVNAFTGSVNSQVEELNGSGGAMDGQFPSR